MGARGWGGARLGEALHAEVLQRLEQLPCRLEMERVDGHLDAQRLGQQHRRLLVVCGALVHAQLAVGGESARSQRRALAHLVRVRVRARVRVRVRVRARVRVRVRVRARVRV